MPTNKTALEMLIERMQGCKTSGKEDLGEFLKGAFWAFDVSIELANQTLPTERTQIEEAYSQGAYKNHYAMSRSANDFKDDATKYYNKTFKDGE